MLHLKKGSQNNFVFYKGHWNTKKTMQLLVFLFSGRVYITSILSCKLKSYFQDKKLGTCQLYVAILGVDDPINTKLNTK